MYVQRAIILVIIPNKQWHILLENFAQSSFRKFIGIPPKMTLGVPSKTSPGVSLGIIPGIPPLECNSQHLLWKIPQGITPGIPPRNFGENNEILGWSSIQHISSKDSYYSSRNIFGSLSWNSFQSSSNNLYESFTKNWFDSTPESFSKNSWGFLSRMFIQQILREFLQEFLLRHIFFGHSRNFLNSSTNNFSYSIINLPINFRKISRKY